MEAQHSQAQAKAKAVAARLNDPQISPVDDIVNYARAYAREKPEMAALWCFGVGFVLGWKLKPW
ncbi:hypothetical protein [Planctomicrobium piriforme]|uniref:Uncharacterized protein n=1 Tax=Planctomicrobium piriforme TaxID=1576369 RepID=A0A1I3KW85_9PLAN|nr:hypothetical protein [Planctomicrobium piriforme]SFI76801.1 hypothetical protein SAMN05421753_11264 [Planctomicrobium piriforme]